MAPQGPMKGIEEGSSGQDSARRIALLVEYEGTRYNGFQLQASAPTIQGELEKALKALTRENIRVRGASRTDAGAHASGQVVDFATCASYPVDVFVKALNWHLPEDIKIRGGRETPFSFHARKSAVARMYRYSLLNSPWPSPLLRNTTCWVRYPLNIADMQLAASSLIGEHDFSAFTTTLLAGRSPVRRIGSWTVGKEGELVHIDAEANGFLPYQIRRTNGLLTDIGLGKAPIDSVKAALNGQAKTMEQRSSLPAKGLCLMHVKYEEALFCDKDTHET
ncbi:MAG: tRNA pseudouridine(38-40) synthase TruA [Dehalococcoidia bacterium]|nr:tRNA pseudouridine(38-40) synthase TruA [Dehalococcoidia bacterium]